MRKRKRNPAATGSSSSSASPAWIDLPRDITANILQRLSAVEILSIAKNVCGTWRAVCKDPAMWRVIDLRLSPESPVRNIRTNEICRRAVELGQGQTISIHMEDLEGSEPLHVKTLLYISNRLRNLRILSLKNCTGLNGIALARAVKRLAVLEELHLDVVKRVHPRRIKTIGISCPTLKSFTFNLPWPRPRRELFDEDYRDLPEEEESEEEDYVVETRMGSQYARAIAQSMPNLRHLALRGNYMRNDGLQALLDGCPRLESLDIRQCYRVDVSGVLGDVCLQRLKDFKIPCDNVFQWIDWDVRRMWKPDGVY